MSHDPNRPKWKREEVPDHKFCFVNIDEYRLSGLWYKLSYFTVFVITFRSVLVYTADFATAILIIAFDQWTRMQADVQKLTIFEGSFFNFIRTYGGAIYLASILVSYFILALDVSKAIKIIRSTDISFAFTEPIAYRYYSLRSYSYWCFFQQVQSQYTFSDKLIQFVFFRLKVWKRLLFAETPRHIINFVLTTYLLYVMYNHARALQGTNNAAASDVTLSNFRLTLFLNYVVDNPNKTQTVRFLLMSFVLTVYFVNVVATVIAALLYVPMVMKIRGNVKEYICHKIDKRIGELLRTTARRRIRKMQADVAANLPGTPALPLAELPMLQHGYAASPQMHAFPSDEFNYSDAQLVHQHHNHR